MSDIAYVVTADGEVVAYFFNKFAARNYIKNIKKDCWNALDLKMKEVIINVEVLDK